MRSTARPPTSTPAIVVALLGRNGAGKVDATTDAGGRLPDRLGRHADRRREGPHPHAGRGAAQGIETIYQTLALADNLDSVSNLFLGREEAHAWRTLDDHFMEGAARKVFNRLNRKLHQHPRAGAAAVGGQRQVLAISRALYFNARILIMDEPCAALGPEETAMVGGLVKQLKADGVGIFLITHDMPDVFALSDRLAVMKNGKLVGTYRTADVNEDEVLGMIIAGKRPEGEAQAEHAVR